MARALDHGSCLVALADGEVAGLVCHTVNRAGWVGPIAVTADQRGRGIGRALLGAACADLRAAGLPDVQIITPTPMEFFARSAGASVSRVFRTFVRARAVRTGVSDTGLGPLRERTRPPAAEPSIAAGRGAGGSRSR